MNYNIFKTFLQVFTKGIKTFFQEYFPMIFTFFHKQIE